MRSFSIINFLVLGKGKVAEEKTTGAPGRTAEKKEAGEHD